MSFCIFKKEKKQQREKYIENVLLFSYIMYVPIFFWLPLSRVARKGVHIFIVKVLYHIACLERGSAYSKVGVKEAPQKKNQWRNPN